MTDRPFLLGVDIGGTFTDLVLVAGDGGRLQSAKELTTPDDPVEAVLSGIAHLLGSAGITAGQIGRVVHATTLATNLIMERKGASVCYVTTEGFGDVPLVGRGVRAGAERYDLLFSSPEAPLRAWSTFEVPERMSPSGQVLRPLDEVTTAAVAERIARQDPESVAVCLLHSYANRAHEQRVGELLRAKLPGAHIALSCDVWPEFREYDRAMTTIMSAYVGPVLAGYIDRLDRRLRGIGISAPLQMMQSNGGITLARAAPRRAIRALESGPAAGVIAAAALGQLYGQGDIISFDMGGTTAKAGVVRNGEPVVTHDFRIGGHASAGSTQTGFPIRIPVVDLAEVGAGGGSLAWVDSGGLPQVGPQSAGADPGPACYGLGGSRPTVTDANLVLGYLDPDYFAAGTMKVSVEAARESIRRFVAEPLAIGVTDAAFGIHRIVNANMAGAIRIVTVERGIDPRDFSLFAFGGAGPVHAARMAEEFGVREIVIPRGAGVMSATGLLSADVAVDYVQTHVHDLDVAVGGEVELAFDRLEADGRADLETQGVGNELLEVVRSVDVRYKGQAHELSIGVGTGPLDPDQLSSAFYALYKERFGIDRHDPVELVNVRVRVVARMPRLGPMWRGPGGATPHVPSLSRTRHAYFPEVGGYVGTPVYFREGLAEGEELGGPAIVESADTTVIVPPGHHASVDRFGSLVIRAG